MDGQTLAPVTGVTLPLDAPVRDEDELAQAARERWGQTRADIEADLAARVETSNEPGRLGRSYQRRRT